MNTYLLVIMGTLLGFLWYLFRAMTEGRLKLQLTDRTTMSLYSDTITAFPVRV
jgi:hypothetical protein